MSLVGGFYAFKKNKCDNQAVYSELKTCSLLSNECRKDNETAVYEFSRGYIFFRKKAGIRSLVSADIDACGNIRLILGFLTLADWQDWDFEEGIARPKEFYTEDFADQVTRAEGEFAAIILHAASETLHVVNDRFAARPMYFRITDEGFYFCSNLFFLSRLCRSPIEFDPVGLMQLYCYTNTIGPFTNLKHCERLLPATHLSVQGQTLQKKQYWTMKYEPDFDLDPRLHAEAVFCELRKSVQLRTRLSSRVLLPLSGGLDSRILAAGLADDSPVPACTMVSEDQFSRDQQTAAAMVAEALSLRHSELMLRPSISERSGDIIRLTGGLIPAQHSAKPVQGPYGQYDIFLDGGPGDVLVGSYVGNMYRTLQRNSRQTMIAYYANDNFGRFSALFNRDFLEDVRTPFRLAGTESVDRLQYATAAEALSLWKMVYRQPAFTFAQISHSHPYGTSVYPHLSYHYTDLILKLPPLWLFKKQFYKYMIYHCAPELRHIPYANTGEFLNGKIGPSTAPMISYKTYAARRRLHAFYARCFPSRRCGENKMDAYYMRQDTKLLAEMREMLIGYPAMSSYFNIDFCIDYLRRFEAGADIPRIASDLGHPVGFMASILYTCKHLLKA